MGTTQGKVKDSFSVKPKPIFKKSQEAGQAPFQIAQTQKNLCSSVIKHDFSKTLKYIQRRDLSRKFSDDLELSTDSQIETIKQYPYCSVGIVMYDIGGLKCYGTGFLIGKNIILTCAHNLFSLDYGLLTNNVSFSLNCTKNKQKEVYKAKQIFFPEQFEKLSLKGNQLSEEDYCRNDFGIIKLDDSIDLQQSYGYLGFSFDSQQHSLTSSKVVMGFTHLDKKLIILQSFERKVKLSDQFISYPFPTDIGMSGGPIIQVFNEKFIAIGIHTSYQGKTKECNGQGIRFTQQKFDQINSWLHINQQVIDLRDKSLGKQGVKQLVKLEKYSFDVINLSKNRLQKDGLKHFSRVQWPNLYNLDLGGNNIGDQGLEYLIKAPMKNLQILNLWGNKIGKTGVQVLGLGKWPKLQNLNLYNNQICNEGLEILVNQDWKHLDIMNLGKNKLSFQAIQQLRRCKWNNILCLNLWGNGISKDKKIVELLHIQFPKMKFLYL